MRVAINGVWVDAYLDTGATISLVSSRFVHYEDLVPKNICGVKTGEEGVTLTEGEIVKPVRTPLAILGSLGVCIYVPASRHWLISYSPIRLT